MVYKKRVFRRKYVRKPAGLSAGVQALKMVKQIKRTTKPEMKFKDYEYQPENFTTTGITLFNHRTIPIGTSQSERIGDVILPQRLTGRLLLNVTADVNVSTVRLIFYRGKREDETILNTLSVLQTDRVTSLYNWYNRSHYSIISDRTYSLGYGSNFAKVISFNHKLSGPLKYARDDNTLVEDGGVYLLMLSEANSEVTYQGQIRLTYTDV